MRVIVSILFLLIALAGSAQDTPVIQFRIPAKVKDSADLTINIAVKNTLNKPILFYNDLAEGALFFSVYNINIEAQKLENGRYSYYRMSYVHPLNPEDTTYEFNKVSIAPGATHILQFNLMQICHYFEQGDYRIRIFLKADKKDFPGKYHFESPWLYFTAEKLIAIMRQQ